MGEEYEENHPWWTIAAYFQVLSIDGYRLFRVSKRKTAIPFEKYLKSASGRAFIKRHPPGATSTWSKS
jgi:hypothetical protein